MRATATTTAIWHDVECGSYEVDLPLWVELAECCEGPVLELGCGTGRVALHLARRGHRVVGLDRDPELIEALAERAGDLPVQAAVADARDFTWDEPAALALAPMQLLQLFSGSAERTACLAAVAVHLRPGGLFAAAIVEEALGGFNREEDVVPDTREVDGWVYSSLPIQADVDARRIAIQRLRKVVSPTGVLERSDNRIELQRLQASTLEAEAARVGLTPADRREIAPTLDHVGSTVVLLERSR